VVKNTVLLLLLLIAGISFGAKADNTPKVVIETNFGDIAIELFPNQAPITVDNFLQYVNSGFYNGLLFHRVVEGFVIQGGGFYVYDNTLYQRQAGDPIINESYNGLGNFRGTIAMARTSEPNSATSQFFINHMDNFFLDRANADDGFGYCVFGRVLTGMDVVDAIAQTPVENIGGGFTHFPYPTFVEIYQAAIAQPGYWLGADLDNSGIVNFEDFAAMAGNWQKTAEQLQGDLDGNQTVDITDIELFADDWRKDWHMLLQADLNDDNIVDLWDYGRLTSDWLETGNGHPSDLNGNGTVDWADLELFGKVWLDSLD